MCWYGSLIAPYGCLIRDSVILLRTCAVRVLCDFVRVPPYGSLPIFHGCSVTGVGCLLTGAWYGTLWCFNGRSWYGSWLSPYGSCLSPYGCLRRELVVFLREFTTRELIYVIRVHEYAIRELTLFAYGCLRYGCLKLPHGCLTNSRMVWGHKRP